MSQSQAIAPPNAHQAEGPATIELSPLPEPTHRPRSDQAGPALPNVSGSGPSSRTARPTRECLCVKIRARREGDVLPLVAVAEAVRGVDRWPPHRVGPTSDFIAPPGPVAAFVAVDGLTVVGHVALHERSAKRVMDVAAGALGVEPSSLAVVSRLFVAPDQRGRGVGMRLTEAAADASLEDGRHPILDVWAELEPAIGLYERAGWRRLGEVTFTFREPCGPDCLHSGNSIRSYVYGLPRG